MIRLPRRPLATDDPTTGLDPDQRTQALTGDSSKPTQTAPDQFPGRRRWTTLTPLYPRAPVGTGPTGCSPSSSAENPGNGHAHAIWAPTAPSPPLKVRPPLTTGSCCGRDRGTQTFADGASRYRRPITKNLFNGNWSTPLGHQPQFTVFRNELQAGHHSTMPTHAIDLLWRRARRRNPIDSDATARFSRPLVLWAYQEARVSASDT